MRNINRIKELRELKNIKQSDFAVKLNVSQGTLSNWERGVHDPDNESLIKMVEFFETTSDYILGLSYDSMPFSKKSPINFEPDIKWGDFGISFYDGRKKLTSKQKDKITKIVQTIVDEFAEEETIEVFEAARGTNETPGKTKIPKSTLDKLDNAPKVDEI